VKWLNTAECRLLTSISTKICFNVIYIETMYLNILAIICNGEVAI